MLTLRDELSAGTLRQAGGARRQARLLGRGPLAAARRAALRAARRALGDRGPPARVPEGAARPLPDGERRRAALGARDADGASEHAASRPHAVIRLRELPDDRVRGVLRRCVRPVVGAHAPPPRVAAVHPRGVVLLLRLDRLALGAAAHRLERRQHGRRPGDRAQPVAGHAQARSRSGGRVRPRPALHVQVPGLLHVRVRRRVRLDRARLAASRSCRSCCRSGSRSSPSRRSRTWSTCTAARRAPPR